MSCPACVMQLEALEDELNGVKSIRANYKKQRMDVEFDEGRISDKQIRAAVVDATHRSFLRPNAVEAISGKNSGDNTGVDFPTIHFEEWEHNYLKVGLMLKGGGCENVGAQYSLPSEKLNANRDLDGCRRVLLDAVMQAQGKGCGPGILGVCIGGDRATGYEFSKAQLLRKLNDRNPSPELDRLEQDIVSTANQLGIGPMGFGGKTTLLGTKIGVLNRLPASYFVSISYMCWAFRRQGVQVGPDGEILKWLY